jgi:hypothetical protein
LAQNRWLERYYKRTILPSESVVHTILVNDERWSIVNDACRYVNWGPGPHATSPQVIRNEDFRKVVRSGQPFARKFDCNVDEAILDRLDEWLESERRQGNE